MAVSMSPKQKVYQGVLQEIRKFIEMNELQAGDKLPSERELSETLQAGRSSVREALRAMELLGLIETRHGEGTFLSTYRSYQTVELLASFILQENRTKKDLLSVRTILEKEAVKLSYHSISKSEIEKLSSIIEDSSKQPMEKHAEFFQVIFNKNENYLMKKIWQLIDEFSHTLSELYYAKGFYLEIIQIYKMENYRAIESLFEELSSSDGS
ncbi:FadR/GntR family transcriptional regulator [Virgibacillus indicus]|uniref:FadR/GntR family transcriptional regulator n=1 Tax=Virgibacillus indicus TaxID=2024554 RepID=UPI0026D2B832